MEVLKFVNKPAPKYHKMFRHFQRIRVLLFREFSSDGKSIKIRQVNLKKISQAERVKNQNLDQRLLFGGKSKSVKTLSTTEDEHGVKSEIFWTIEHDPAVKKSSKKLKKNAEDPEGIEVTKSYKRASVRKIIKVPEEKAPEALARFKSDFPKPVKITIKDALDNLQTHINPPPNETSALQEIPFDATQLKTIPSFPLILRANDLTLSRNFSSIKLKSNASIPTPSVTKILQATMPLSQRNALIQWKNLKIAELGLEGFEALQKSHLSRGKKFHECVQKYFNGIELDEEEIPTDVRDIWQSVFPVLHEFEAPALFTEQFISHPYLHYKGVVDCVSSHENALTVIEWKNSDRHKKSLANTYDAPIQLCAYVAALNATEFKGKDQINKGVVVVAYNDGQAADIFKLNEQELNKYWKMWLNRLQEYWTRYRDNTLTDEVI